MVKCYDIDQLNGLWSGLIPEDLLKLIHQTGSQRIDGPVNFLLDIAIGSVTVSLPRPLDLRRLGTIAHS